MSSSPPNDPLQQHLHQVGLKATLPRLKVLEAMRSATDRRHFSAEELHRRLAQQQIEIGLGTLYRVLSQLEAAGLVSRCSFNDGPALYELHEGQQHDHLVCLYCGRVDEFKDPQIESRQQAVARARGFRLLEHRLALMGRCGACCDADAPSATKTTPKAPPHA